MLLDVLFDWGKYDELIKWQESIYIKVDAKYEYPGVVITDNLSISRIDLSPSISGRTLIGGTCTVGVTAGLKLAGIGITV